MLMTATFPTPWPFTVATANLDRTEIVRFKGRLDMGAGSLGSDVDEQTAGSGGGWTAVGYLAKTAGCYSASNMVVFFSLSPSRLPPSLTGYSQADDCGDRHASANSLAPRPMAQGVDLSWNFLSLPFSGGVS